MAFIRTRRVRRSATRIAIALNGSLIALMYLFALLSSR